MSIRHGLAAALLLLLPGVACGEEGQVAPRKTLSATYVGSSVTAQLGAAQTQSQSPAQSQHHCCNRKGALIGAAAGAALGALLVLKVCDAGDCTVQYIKTMVVTGGLGATVGAFAEARRTPGIGIPFRRFRVRAVWARTTRAALATLRF